jgi:hypothetical protein
LIRFRPSSFRNSAFFSRSAKATLRSPPPKEIVQFSTLVAAELRVARPPSSSMMPQTQRANDIVWKNPFPSRIKRFRGIRRRNPRPHTNMKARRSLKVELQTMKPRTRRHPANDDEECNDARTTESQDTNPTCSETSER